jgi:hypothetical protein
MAMAAGKEGGFLEPTFKRAARIWWAWAWRSLVFGGAAGLFATATLSLSGILEHISDRAGQAVSMGFGLALAVPIGIWVSQLVLEKNFGDFRLRLVPKAPPVPPPPIDETS